MKQYPAIDIRTDAPDLLLAIVDDFGPTAVEERGAAVRIFFATPADRDEAQRALSPRFDVTAIDVDDEDWARRSQENLQPVTVGRITVFPTAHPAPGSQYLASSPEYQAPSSQPLAPSLQYLASSAQHPAPI